MLCELVLVLVIDMGARAWAGTGRICVRIEVRRNGVWVRWRTTEKIGGTVGTNMLLGWRWWWNSVESEWIGGKFFWCEYWLWFNNLRNIHVIRVLYLTQR